MADNVLPVCMYLFFTPVRELVRALYRRTEATYNLQLIFMGHRRAGITTTVKRILNVPPEMTTTKRTNCNELIKTGRIRLRNGEWLDQPDTTDYKEILIRMKATSYEEEVDDWEKLSKKENASITTKAENDAFELRSMDFNDDTMCHLMISDLSGRLIFNSCHQLLMSHRAMYLLVFDISKELDFEILDKDFCLLGLQQRIPIKEFTAFLLRSIHLYHGEEKDAFPKVFLIGTHGDLVDQYVAEARMKELKQEISKLPHLQRHIIGDVIVNNTNDEDIEVNKLRNIIFKKAKAETFWGKEIPAFWMPLEKEIITQRDKNGKRILTLREIRDLNQECYIKLESNEEIATFLAFQKSLGNMMFFEGNGPDDLLILDPQWLIESLKQLITDEEFFKKSKGPPLSWQGFQDSAKLHMKLVEAVWGSNEDKTFIDNKEKILEILDSTELVCMPKVYNSEGMLEKLDYYMVPSMLRPNEEGTQILQNYLKHCKGKSATLYFVFRENFMPPAIFSRVQGACIKEFRMADASDKHLVFHEASVFKLNRLYDLHLQRCQHTIQITIISVKEKSVKPKFCRNIMTFLDEVLLKITFLYRSVNQKSDLPFFKAIRCDQSEGELDALLPLEDLLASDNYRCNHQDPEKSHDLMTSDVLETWAIEKSVLYGGIRFPVMPVLREETINKRKIQLNMQDLGRLARSKLCADLYLLSHTMLTQREIDQLKSDNKSDQNFAILMTWNRKTRDGLSIKKIQQTLADAGRVVSTDSLKEVLENKDYTACFEGIPSSFLDSKLNDVGVDQISLRTGIEYLQLAVELCLSPLVIERVITETPRLIDRTRALLREWIFSQGSAATYRAIGQAIVEVGMDTTILFDCYCVD